jgi:hypothetical protein
MRLHILLGLQDAPGAAINASDVTELSFVDVLVRPVLDALAAASSWGGILVRACLANVLSEA